MLNRTSLSQPIAPPLVEENALLDKVRWRRLADLVRLPSTFAGYMAFLASLLVLAFTMALHVMLSAEIMLLESRLDDMQEEYAHIERANANMVWEISQGGSMTHLHDIAVASGYTTQIPVVHVDGSTLQSVAVAPVGALTQPSAGLAGAAGSTNTEPTTSESAVDLPEYFTIPGAAADESLAGADGTGANTVELAPGETSLPFTVDQMPADNSAQSAPAALPTDATSAPEATASWWQRAIPDWLRPARIGEATGETLDWLRERMPSGEWLRNNW